MSYSRSPGEANETPTNAEFRQFASCFPTGVVVVTARGSDGELYGTTMNSVTCLSLNPPTYLMCFDRASRTLSALSETKAFCINILATDQATISKIFASKGTDKYSKVEFSCAENGAPILDGVAAACEGAVTGECDGGDHVIVLGRINRVHIKHREPLVYERGKFRAFASAIG